MNTPRMAPIGMLAVLLTLGAALVAGGTGVLGSSHTGGSGSRWVVTDLGDLGAPESSAASDINNRGQVVGVSRTKLGVTRAFLWQDGVMAPLDKSRYSSARAINDRGQVIGVRTASNGQTQAVMWDHSRLQLIATKERWSDPIALNERGDVLVQEAFGGFLWQAGKRIDLAGSEGRTINPIAMNNAGQVVGVTYSTPASFETYHVVHWEGGVATDLGQGSPTDINERGWIVGNRLFDGQLHAALWRAGQTIDLGTLPGTTSSMAYAVNERGQVTGKSGKRAFLWEGGTMKEIATVATGPYATAISERGQVVGTRRTMNRNVHVFLWRNGNMTDLGTLPGIRSIHAVGINNRNQVLGNTRHPDSRSGPPAHAVVWTRRD